MNLSVRSTQQPNLQFKNSVADPVTAILFGHFTDTIIAWRKHSHAAAWLLLNCLTLLEKKELFAVLLM